MVVDWNKYQAWLVGLGLVFMAFYCQAWEYRIDGIRCFFFPEWGEMILLAVATYCLLDRNLELGPKKLWVPIVTIFVFILIRTILDGGNDLLDQSFLAILSVLIYAMGRKFGIEIFRPMVLFVAVASILVIIATIIMIDDLADIGTGWTFSPFSYTWLATFIGMGGILGAYTISTRKWRYVFLSLCLIGLFLTRAPVAVILIALLLITMFWQRDYNRYILAGLAVISVLFVVFWFGALNGGEEERIINVLGGTDHWGEGRIPAYERVVSEISLFGHGFDRYSYQLQTGNVVVHQMPLIIMDQIGLLPALGWLFVTVYLAVKSRYRYIWAAVISFCVLDYMLWTYFGYWWWAIVGSTSLSIMEANRRGYDNKHNAPATVAIAGSNRGDLGPYSGLC